MIDDVTDNPPVMPPRDLWPCVTVHRSTGPSVPQDERSLAWQVDENGQASPLEIGKVEIFQGTCERTRMVVNGWAEVIRGECWADGVLWLRIWAEDES